MGRLSRVLDVGGEQTQGESISLIAWISDEDRMPVAHFARFVGDYPAMAPVKSRRHTIYIVLYCFDLLESMAF
jgi:hypothetical protein